MSKASDWIEAAILNQVFRNTPNTPPAQVWLALYKTDPADSDSGMEVSGGGYARQQIVFNAPAQSGNLSTIQNTNNIVFPIATTNWTGSGETVGFWGIRTAQTGGNLLVYGAWDAADVREVLKNDQVNIGAGRIKVTLNQKASIYLQSRLLNHYFRNIAFPGPASVFLGLYKTDPTNTDIGTEISGGAYVRQQIAFGTPSQVGGLGAIQNTNDISFPIAESDWGDIAFFALRDAAIAGNLLCFAPWSMITKIAKGQQYAVLVGGTKVTFA